MNKCELSFSRDGGKTYEVVAFIGEVTIEDLGVFQDDPRAGDIIVVGGGGPFEISGKMQATSEVTPAPAQLFGPLGTPGPDRSKPWLKPKKGRGRHL